MRRPIVLDDRDITTRPECEQTRTATRDTVRRPFDCLTD